MKRLLYPSVLTLCVALMLCSTLLLEPRTHSQSLTIPIVNWQDPLLETNIEKKISKDLLQKIADGTGDDLVRVIIQPSASQSELTQSELTVDSALEFTGARDIRKLKTL